MKAVTGAIIFVSGAAIGAASSYFVTKKVICDKMDAELRAELDDIRAQYKHSYEEQRQLLEEIANNTESNETPTEVEPEKVTIEQPKIANMVNYSNIEYPEVMAQKMDEEAKALDEKPEPEPDPEEEAIQEAEANTEEVPLGGNKKPYRIDEAQFSSYDGFEKEVLIYYADGILAEESTDDILDIRNHVGTEINSLPHVHNESICIRNEWLGVDYQIFYNGRTYADVTQTI